MPRVVPVQVGMVGVDTSVKLTAMLCRGLRATGIRFVGRYVPLPGNDPSHDLDAGEVSAILDADLGLYFIQHVLEPGWHASTDGGLSKGATAVSHVMQCHGLPGVSVVWDAEETASGPDDVQAEGTAWWNAVKGGGYHPVAYQGSGIPFNGSDWRRRLPFEAYMKSLSDVPSPTGRGWVMIQGYPQQTLLGIPVDYNFAQQDYLGGSMRMMVA